MKKLAAGLLLFVLSLTLTVPSYAKTPLNPEARAAQKRAKKQQKAMRKQAKAQQKAQQKAAKQAMKHVRTGH